MHLAIFLDAAAVAGDAGLLREARAIVDRILVGDDVFFARFASAADQFDEPSGWWARLSGLRGRDEHAARPEEARHLSDRAWRARARAAAPRRARSARRRGCARWPNASTSPDQMARDLIEALHFLMVLKLDDQPASARSSGQPVDNLVQLSTLGTLERDLMKDALAIIKALSRTSAPALPARLL